MIDRIALLLSCCRSRRRLSCLCTKKSRDHSEPAIAHISCARVGFNGFQCLSISFLSSVSGSEVVGVEESSANDEVVVKGRKGEK